MHIQKGRRAVINRCKNNYASFGSQPVMLLATKELETV